MSERDKEELEKYWASIYVPIEPVRQIKTYLFRERCLPHVREIFSAHGITLDIKDDHCVVTFPAGTTRQEILPRPNFSVRFRVVLPDGYEMEDVVPRGSLLSRLGFPEQDFSDC